MGPGLPPARGGGTDGGSVGDVTAPRSDLGGRFGTATRGHLERHDKGHGKEEDEEEEEEGAAFIPLGSSPPAKSGKSQGMRPGGSEEPRMSGFSGNIPTGKIPKISLSRRLP